MLIFCCRTWTVLPCAIVSLKHKVLRYYLQKPTWITKCVTDSCVLHTRFETEYGNYCKETFVCSFFIYLTSIYAPGISWSSLQQRKPTLPLPWICYAWPSCQNSLSPRTCWLPSAWHLRHCWVSLFVAFQNFSFLRFTWSPQFLERRDHHWTPVSTDSAVKTRKCSLATFIGFHWFRFLLLNIDLCKPPKPACANKT